MTNRSISEFPPARSSPGAPPPVDHHISVLSLVGLLPAASSFFPLSLTIPALTVGTPVSPIIPAHPQKQGGGGIRRNAFADNSFVFFRCVNYMLNYMIDNIVGAPTFSFLHSGKRSQNPPASEGGPYTNWELCAARPASEGESYTRFPPSVFSYT